MFVYGEGDRIVIEPVPSLEKLHGIHAGDHDPVEVLAAAHETRDGDGHREDERAERLRPSEDE